MGDTPSNLFSNNEKWNSSYNWANYVRRLGDKNTLAWNGGMPTGQSDVEIKVRRSTKTTTASRRSNNDGNEHWIQIIETYANKI